MIFRLGVEDRFKVIHWMEAVGVDSITDATPLQDKAGIRKAYPEIKKKALNQPKGPAGLLVSMTERRLLAEGGRTVDKMRLSDTLLWCGQVLTGVAPKRTGWKGGERLSAECRAMQGALADKPPQGQTFCISGLGKAADSVLGLEDNLEARVPPLGSACLGCAKCCFRRERCTEEDRAILARVEEDMVRSGGQPYTT